MTTPGHGAQHPGPEAMNQEVWTIEVDRSRLGLTDGPERVEVEVVPVSCLREVREQAEGRADRMQQERNEQIEKWLQAVSECSALRDRVRGLEEALREIKRDADEHVGRYGSIIAGHVANLARAALSVGEEERHGV
jgi:hypothetical protein